MTVEEHLTHFAELLRQNGIPVSTGEIIDAARALSLVGFESREEVRWTLSATLVKQPRNRRSFDRLFDLYFSGMARLWEALDSASAQAIQSAGTLERAELERLAEAFRRLVPALPSAASAALRGDVPSLLSGMRQAALPLDFSRLDGPSQQGFLVRRLLQRLGVDEARRQFDALAAHLRASGMSAEGLDLAGREFKSALRLIENAAADWVDQEARMRSRRGESGDLRETAFAALTPEESEIVSRSVRRLAQRLRTRLACRQKSFHRGRPDIRRTLRESSGRAAEGLSRIIFRRRRAVRPELAVLCDLSDSVRPTARMMLLFAMTLQNMFARTRTFVFVNELREVTDRLKGMDPRSPLNLSTLSDVISFGGNSDYGRVFSELARCSARAFGSRTTLIIIGDGRSNYGDPGMTAFEDIARRAGRLLWVTPEPRERWDDGDCELWRYERSCTRAAAVTCLADLENLADLLVPEKRG